MKNVFMSFVIKALYLFYIMINAFMKLYMQGNRHRKNIKVNIKSN